MPRLESELMDGLPIIRILIRQGAGESYVETPMPLSAGLDTGANEVFSAPGILSGFGFVATHRWNVQTGSPASEQVDGFDVDVGVFGPDEELHWFPLRVAEMPNMPLLGCQLGLGHPFLRKCVLVCDGPNEKFTLDW